MTPLRITCPHLWVWAVNRFSLTESAATYQHSCIGICLIYSIWSTFITHLGLNPSPFIPFAPMDPNLLLGQSGENCRGIALNTTQLMHQWCNTLCNALVVYAQPADTDRAYHILHALQSVHTGFNQQTDSWTGADNNIHSTLLTYTTLRHCMLYTSVVHKYESVNLPYTSQSALQPCWGIMAFTEEESEVSAHFGCMQNPLVFIFLFNLWFHLHQALPLQKATQCQARLVCV